MQSSECRPNIDSCGDAIGLNECIRFLYTVALASNWREKTVFLHHGAHGSYMSLHRMKWFQMQRDHLNSQLYPQKREGFLCSDLEGAHIKSAVNSGITGSKSQWILCSSSKAPNICCIYMVFTIYYKFHVYTTSCAYSSMRYMVFMAQFILKSKTSCMWDLASVVTIQHFWSFVAMRMVEISCVEDTVHFACLDIFLYSVV